MTKDCQPYVTLLSRPHKCLQILRADKGLLVEGISGQDGAQKRVLSREGTGCELGVSWVVVDRPGLEEEQGRGQEGHYRSSQRSSGHKFPSTLPHSQTPALNSQARYIRTNSIPRPTLSPQWWRDNVTSPCSPLPRPFPPSPGFIPFPHPRVAHFLVPKPLPVDDVVPLAGPPLGPGPSDPTYAHLAEAPAPHRQPAPTGVISGHHHGSDPHHVPGGGGENRDNTGRELKSCSGF